MRGSDLLGLLRRLFGCLGAELILRPVRLKIGGAEMICNKGRLADADDRLAYRMRVNRWRSGVLPRCKQPTAYPAPDRETNYIS
jgi:hypothetical protein